MDKKSMLKAVVAFAVALAFLAPGSAIAGTYLENDGETVVSLQDDVHHYAEVNVSITNNDRDLQLYEGYLDLFVIEIYSRWQEASGPYYHNALLDVPLAEHSFSVLYEDTYEKTIIWDVLTTFPDVQDDNLEFVALISDAEWHQGYSYPGYPFDAYYTDATVIASIGTTANNTIPPEYEGCTHTVLCEFLTAKTCGPCQGQDGRLWTVYTEKITYPYAFYYICMVHLEGGCGIRGMGHYNGHAFPTTFWDGGYVKWHLVYFDTIRDLIEECRKREVNDLYVEIMSVRWVNHSEPPSTPSVPSGPAGGRTGKEYAYSSIASDPENDRLLYLFDWGDGTDSGWVGPYGSGAEATHCWTGEGEYEVKVKVDDRHGSESDWSETLIVNISEDVVEITKVSGGLFSVDAVVENIGSDEEVYCVNWSISLDGGLILKGSETSGVIPWLPRGDKVIVKSGPIIGLGKTVVTVEIEVIGVTSYTIRQNASMLLFFIKILDE